MILRQVAVLSAALCAIGVAQTNEGRVHKQKARADWFDGRRWDAGHPAPPRARIHALEQLAPPAANASTWRSIGPKPTIDAETANLVTSGRIPAIAIDPRNPSVIYVGAASGGVWKSIDGGSSWRALTDDQNSLAIGSIVLDPKNSSIVYAGTGEANYSANNYYGAGILKSTDAGATWTLTEGPFLHAYIGSVAVSPANSQVVLAAAGNIDTRNTTGIWRSADSGNTWTRVLNGVGNQVVFDSVDGNIAYATLGDPAGSSLNGLYRSADGGQSWSPMRGSGANVLPTANVGRSAIALAPSSANTLYLAVSDFVTGFLLDVYKSIDGGATWRATKAPNVCIGSHGLGGQCGYDLTIAVHPKDPAVVYVFGDHIMARSLDGGLSWAQLPDTGPNAIKVHVDEHALVFSPDGSQLYVGNDGGIYRTGNPLASQAAQVNWTQLNDGLAITQFFPGIAIHPSDVNWMLAGAQDNRTQRYAGDLGWNAVVCGDGGYNAFDPSFPDIAFTTCTSKDLPTIVYRSQDSGNTWRSSQYGIEVTERSDFIPPMVIDPSQPQIVYYGTYRLWQSRDSGGYFRPVSPDLTAGGSTVITTIAVAPSDGNVVYVGSSSQAASNPALATNSRVRLTRNALDASPSWADRSAGLPSRVVTRVTVDPTDPNKVYATFAGFSSNSDTQGHVFRSTNSGTTWSDISGNLPNVPVNDLIVDPDVPSTLYIATDVGVLVSTTGGSSWALAGNGMPKVVVLAVALHRPTRTLRAGTYGRGMWDLAVPLSGRSSQPIISAITPTSANAGSASFTLQVSGSNFTSGTVLRWQGAVRPTTILDSGHIRATISAADIATAGRAAIDVYNLAAGAGASNAVNFPIGPAPATTPQSAVNAAFPASATGLAPGSIVSLYGTNLSGATVVSDLAPPLPALLDDTSVLVQDTGMPLFFVSPGQINFQMPWYPSSTPPFNSTFTVQHGSLSTSVVLTVRAYAPGIFTTNSRGSGQASALVAGTSSIAAPTGAFPGSRPANRGEYVSLYCTGLGLATNRPALGLPAPSDPLATTIAAPTVTIGGINARVAFSGLAPGYVGLYQVNVQVPAGVTTGSAVPVVLTIGGVLSNTVTIAVQ